MPRDLAISNGRLLGMFDRPTWSHAQYVRTVQESIDRFASTNLCPGCGLALRTTQGASDRQPVLSEA